MSFFKKDKPDAAEVKSEKFTCPRRRENCMDDPYYSPFVGAGTDLDEWRPLRPLGGGEAIAPQGYRQCSYCGSLNPDDFMQALLNSDQLGPTDKSYKVYVGKEYTDEGAIKHWLELMGFCDEHKDLVKPAHDYAKFYFQHLSDQQKYDFVDLLNLKLIKIGYPGYFYRLPYFATSQR